MGEPIYTLSGSDPATGKVRLPFCLCESCELSLLWFDLHFLVIAEGTHLILCLLAIWFFLLLSIACSHLLPIFL